MNSPFETTTRVTVLLAIALFAGLPQNALAEGKKNTGPAEVKLPAAGQAPAPPKGPEEADVQSIKEKYWASGKDMELGVVQNRLYTNRKKFELGFLIGSVASDPFLVNKSLSLTAGYHFSELFSVHLGFTKNLVSSSSALTELEQQTGSTASTNKQQNWFTADTRWSLLYGKVSLLGASILYFDAYLSGGFGVVSTESGKNFVLMPGIGQIFHINRTLGINFAYKLFWYKERILSKSAATLGQELGTRGNFGSTLMLGITVVLDPFSSSDVAPGPKPADGK